jgi:actin-like protein 6A
LLSQRSIIASIAFEKLGVSNIFFLKTPVLSCFATGRSTSLVVDSGDSHTRVTAVHDGFVLNKTSKVVPYGGKTLSQEF